MSIKRALIGFLLTGIVIIAVSTVLRHSRQETIPLPEEDQMQMLPEGRPVFTWHYTPFAGEETPKTAITIRATYPNGEVVSKDIGIVEGGCNVYDNRDADVYKQSDMIICYYAGLGRYYKVVEGNGVYKVQRKIFEEASPDYNPPQQSFETVVEF